MKWLLMHGWQWDPALDSMPKQWLPEELDRIAVALNWGPFNKLRSEISHASQNNENLIAGARALGYPTICGHSHIPGSQDIFRNDGSWRGPYQPHYVLFPKDKVACISDLHIGAPEAVPYAPALLAFLKFAGKNDWTVWSLGDTLDLWAHDAKTIVASCPDEIRALIAYPKLNLVGGNHNNDITTLSKTINGGKPIPWYAFHETDDKPELIGWPT